MVLSFSNLVSFYLLGSFSIVLNRICLKVSLIPILLGLYLHYRLAFPTQRRLLLHHHHHSLLESQMHIL